METETTSSIHDLMAAIRDIVNISWKHYKLRQDSALFSQLVSALDTVEDAEEAIQAFKTIEVGENSGSLYLIIYGLMQALFVQQDACTDLCEALDIDNTISKYPQLVTIREIRNDSVGHPTKRHGKRGQPSSYHQISRMTMSQEGFQLLSYFSDGTNKHRDISIPDLLNDQKEFIVTMLTSILADLESEVQAHKEKFRLEKLTLIFPETLTYAFEKTWQGLYSGPIEIGRFGINLIADTVQNFHEAVKRRDMDAYSMLLDELKYIDHAIARIKVLMEAQEHSTLQADDEKDAHIYYIFLRYSIDQLRKYASEIDEEYSS